MARATARLFDAMADDYERLEPWYEHLYAVLHTIIEIEIPAATRERRALDAGCGTGFQTSLLEALGYETHGVDISAGLLAVAARTLGHSCLARASLEALPYADRSFDVIVCCGSTLSFVDRPAQALAEIGRVLRPRGTLLLECEHKWSLDLLWALVSSLTRDALGYGISPRSAWRQIARPLSEGFVIEYERAPLRLFTLTELRAMLGAAGLAPVRRWGIHWATNLIPSTVLHREGLGRAGAALFRGLGAIDRRFAASAIARQSANSLVLLARKSAR
jgi:SAM-dependent methyltransferase